MPVTVYFEGGRRLSAVSNAPRVARMLEELSEANEVSRATEENTAAMVSDNQESEAASFFAEAAELPFTDDLARGNVCAFIAGRAGEADLSKVTVMSILSFNPGMRVAVAAEDAGLGAFQR